MRNSSSPAWLVLSLVLDLPCVSSWLERGTLSEAVVRHLQQVYLRLGPLLVWLLVSAYGLESVEEVLLFPQAAIETGREKWAEVESPMVVLEAVLVAWSELAVAKAAQRSCEC